jgi:ribonuclease Y
MITAIIAVICTLAISVPVTFLVTSNYRKKQQEETIGNAQEKARAIID